MGAPSTIVRTVTYARDLHQCVCCGNLAPLSYQHRQAVGMGGSKRRPDVWEGVTACVLCNELFEGVLQEKALRYGWKVRKWVADVASVPVFVQWAGIWVLLTTGGEWERITRAEAERRMLATYGDEWLGWGA